MGRSEKHVIELPQIIGNLIFPRVDGTLKGCWSTRKKGS